MVSFKEQGMVMEIDHFTTPEDLKNLQLAIINILQIQFVSDKDLELGSDVIFGNFVLLELLKALVEERKV